jgi:hypothetical protein
MKPAAERAAALAERLEQAAKEGTVADIARAIVTTIDESLKERGRPGKRDREATPDGSMPGNSCDPKSPR